MTKPPRVPADGPPSSLTAPTPDATNLTERGEIRVLHILAELRPSGAETMLYCAADAFKQLGVKGFILATSAVDPGPFAADLERAGYTIFHIPFEKSFSFFLRLYRLLREQRFDVVHTHRESASLYIQLTARLAGVRRLINTVHSTFDFVGWLRLRRIVVRFLATHALGVRRVAISESVRENESTRFFSSTTVVPNWYDSGRFLPPTEKQRRDARIALGLPDDQFVLVSVGNCSEIKRHELVINALAKIPPDLRVLYLHAGAECAGAPERDLARTLGVSEKIRFLGAVPDVVALLHAADAFAMPSRYEGFGIALVEALATGLPTILTRVPGLRDFERYYPNLGYHEAEPAACAAKIVELAKLSIGERLAVANSYGAISRANFSIEQGAAGYAHLYRGREK